MKKHIIAVSAIILLLLSTSCHNSDGVPPNTTSTESTSACTHLWSEWKVVTAPTCDTDGEEIRSCTSCDDTQRQLIPKLNHVGTTTEKIITKEPDCTNDGSQDILCVCGVVIRTEAIPAVGHTPVTDAAVAATCTASGLTEGSHCSVCDVVITAQSTTDKLNHTVVVEPGVDATCKRSGRTEGRHCSVCGEVFAKKYIIPKLDHTIVTDPAIPATCSGPGRTEGSHCSTCGEVITERGYIPQLRHHSMTDHSVPATCYSTGLTVGSHCLVCGKVLTKQQVIPIMDHTMATKVVPSNGFDPEYTLHFCIFCSYSYKGESKEINPSEYAIDKLKFTLDDTYLSKLSRAFQKCLTLYKSKNINLADKLISTMYEMKSYWDEIERQKDIANLFRYYDVSDKKLQENYNRAYNASVTAHDTSWYLCDEAHAKTSVFSDVLINFYNSNYTIVSGPKYDVSTYRDRMDAIENEFLQFNTTGTADEVYEMYTEYLELSHKLAEAYGYDNYYEYATERIYERDYGKTEREAFREYVREYVVPLCKKLQSEYKEFDRTISRDDYYLSIDYDKNRYDSFGEDYLFSYFDSLPGNTGIIMKNAFEGNRILIGDQDNSYPTALVMMIGTVPYCYFHHENMDLTTVTHELGHYYADTVIDPFYKKSQDIMEVHSEGNVMLMFRYLSNTIDTPAFDSFVNYALYGMAYGAVYSAIRDEFAEIMFSDPNAPNYTIEEIGDVMAGLLEKYDATDISNQFTEQQMTYWHRLGLRHPVYDISYAVSFVVVYQLYCNSEYDYQAAAEQYCKIVTEMDLNSKFIKTVENAGLISPFKEEAYANFGK